MGPDFFAPLDSANPTEAILTLMGSPDDDDRAWLSLELERAGQRTPNRPEAGNRHMSAAFRFGWPELGQLASFSTPALVIHGTADQVLPVRHAQPLAAGIANSDLQLIDGMVHLPTRSEWDRIARLASAHIAGTERQIQDTPTR